MTAPTEGEENPLIRHLLTRYLPLEGGIPDVLRSQRPWELILRDSESESDADKSVAPHQLLEGRKTSE